MILFCKNVFCIAICYPIILQYILISLMSTFASLNKYIQFYTNSKYTLIQTCFITISLSVLCSLISLIFHYCFLFHKLILYFSLYFANPITHQSFHFLFILFLFYRCDRLIFRYKIILMPHKFIGCYSN